MPSPLNTRRPQIQNFDLHAQQIRAVLDRPIVLVGLMGAGKSKLGRMLAKTLVLPFYDSDDEIEQSAGCSVAQIFDRFGEPAFRAAEARIFDRLLAQGPCVIASGGGSVMTPDIADKVFSQATSIWVRADIDLMVARSARNQKRPLLQGQDHRRVLEDLIRVRYPVYERAEICVQSHDGPPTDMLSQALERLDSCLDKRRISA